MDLLSTIAHEALVARGFLPDFQPNELAECQQLHEYEERGLKDLRDFYWVSIDNDDSLDLDQLSFAQGNRVFVAIADVDHLVRKGSLIDVHACHNTTSIYTPTQVFPMLPILLSNNLTSLNPNVDRIAIVTEMEIDQEGAFHLVDVYRALVNNREKLSYNQVSEWMKDGQMHPQIDLQDRLAQKIKAYRIKQGALQMVMNGVEAKIQNRYGVILTPKRCKWSA
jgi:exoribonuclease-2